MFAALSEKLVKQLFYLLYISLINSYSTCSFTLVKKVCFIPLCDFLGWLTLFVLAFVCETCGRRFGVNSNLNRHMKRCTVRSATQQAADEFAESVIPEPTIGGRATEQVAGPSSSAATASQSETSPPNPAKRKRTASSTTTSAYPGISTAQLQSSSKRRRRAPSPSQWVPTSLLPFKLCPIECTKSTPVPLPPVAAFKDPKTNEWVEERDSWDENVGATPYHPCAWKGRLPGPALGFGGKNIRNLGALAGGFVMGRLALS